MLHIFAQINEQLHDNYMLKKIFEQFLKIFVSKKRKVLVYFVVIIVDFCKLRHQILNQKRPKLRIACPQLLRRIAPQLRHTRHCAMYGLGYLRARSVKQRQQTDTEILHIYPILLMQPRIDIKEMAIRLLCQLFLVLPNRIAYSKQRLLLAQRSLHGFALLLQMHRLRLRQFMQLLRQIALMQP